MGKKSGGRFVTPQERLCKEADEAVKHADLVNQIHDGAKGTGIWGEGHFPKKQHR